MFEIAEFEARRHVRGTLYLSTALVAYVWLVVALFPSIKDSGVDFQTYVESLPPELSRAFVGEATTFTTMEGFLAVEVYQLIWLLVLGAYFAYAGASLVASEVEDGSIDVLLANPVSRTRYVVGKYLSLVPVVLTVNALTLVGTYAGVAFIGESIDPANLVLLHALSIVYLLACAGLGLFASVAFDAARRAQTVGVGAVFGMFLVDTLTLETDYEWIGDPALPRYFDPSDVLVAGEVDWLGLALLVAVTVALVVASAELFERRDIAS